MVVSQRKIFWQNEPIALLSNLELVKPTDLFISVLVVVVVVVCVCVVSRVATSARLTRVHHVAYEREVIAHVMRCNNTEE